MDKRALVMRISLVLFVVSFIAGPGYYSYCSFLAGSDAGSHSLSPEPEGPGGLRAFKPVDLELNPAMNPVRFIIGMTSDPSGEHDVSLRNDYRATLLQGKRRLWEDSFSVGSDAKESGSKRSWMPLEAFEVPQAGRYRLTVREVSKPRLSVGGAEVTVRRNTVSPNMPIVIVGAIATALSFLVLVIAGLWPAFFPSRAEKEEKERLLRQLQEKQPLVGTFMNMMSPKAGTGTMVFMLVAGAIIFLLLYWGRG